METSAPKRRKTSPTSSVQLSGSDGSAPLSSDGATRRSSRLQRPSFASPTKASLARANPDILERRSAPQPQRQPSSTADHAGPTSAGSDDEEEQAVTAQLEGASENRPASDPVGPGSGGGPVVAEPQSPVRRAMGGMRGRPRRSMNKPSPRPLPPPSTQEEELLDPFKGRALHRSPPRGVLPVQEPEEPELPPTPTEKGISDRSAVNTSPMGIHNTPSKRPRRSRALADKLRSGSSPLKQPPMRPIDLGIVGKGSSQMPVAVPISKSAVVSNPPSKAASSRLRNTSDKGAKTAPPEQQAEIASEAPHPARGVPEHDPFADKKATRDSLLAEAARMEADLAAVRKENNRLHAFYLRDGNATVRQTPENPATLLGVLERHALPPEKESPPDPSQIWLEAALDPVSLLPFGNPSIALPNPFRPAEGWQEPMPPPASHHPLPMTAPEELPYLQLFTPLVYTSTTTFVPREPDQDDDAGPLMQQQNISISSRPRGLFAARIEMLVNTKTLSVSELSVPKLEPAAVTELGPFVKQILDSETGPAGALKRNVSILTWAMAEWTRLASKRARFWCRVTEELGHKEGVADCARKMRQGRRRRRQQSKDEADSSEDEGNEGGAVTKSQLLPFMGRTSLDLDLGSGGGGAVELRISWKIGFDWTGEGNSAIGVLVQAPGKWHLHDERGSIAGIPAVFDKLLQEGGQPIGALRTVVALLVGDMKD